MLKVLREVDPSLEFKWDVRDAVTVRPPRAPRMWARLKTKESAALECWFIGRPGQFNLSRVEGLGREPVIEMERDDGIDVLKLRFVSSDDLHPQKLKALLAEHLKGFKATFGTGEEKEAG